MTNTAFTVREMRETDLPTCLEFTQQVKWPHRMGDWQLHFSQGNGSIIENAQGDIVGCILWWEYGAEYATVGLVVVPAHMQGNGLGRKLMDTVMSQTGERSLQLVATVAGKRLYQQCGFTEAGLIYQMPVLNRLILITSQISLQWMPLLMDAAGRRYLLLWHSKVKAW